MNTWHLALRGFDIFMCFLPENTDCNGKKNTFFEWWHISRFSHLSRGTLIWEETTFFQCWVLPSRISNQQILTIQTPHFFFSFPCMFWFELNARSFTRRQMGSKNYFFEHFMQLFLLELVDQILKTYFLVYFLPLWFAIELQTYAIYRFSMAGSEEKLLDYLSVSNLAVYFPFHVTHLSPLIFLH